VEILRNSSRAGFAALRRGRAAQASRYPEAQRVELVRHPGRGVARVGREVRRALDLVSGGVHEVANLETCPPLFRRRAAELCAQLDPTHVIVSYAKLTPALPESFDGVTIVDTHDCQTRLVEESQRHAGTRRLVSVPRHERSERAALGRYDRVVAINPEEARRFAEWAPDAEVSFIPHFTPAAPLPSIEVEDAEHDAFFVGSASSFNVLALRWLLEEVLPRVRETAPKFRLAAVGAMTADARIPQALRSRATLLGRVNDIERIYRTSRIVIVPIRAGAGMKTKIVEALAFRRPVVCTSVAAEGIALVHRESAWIADDATGLADGLLALHRDQALWEHLAAGGSSVHARDHSPDAIAPAIEALLAPLSGGKRSAR
jgi:glycosyltransferase involved in cell wall biosynthesis